MRFEALAQVIDELIAVDLQGPADGDDVIEVHRQLSRLGAVAAWTTASWDATGAWEADRARSGATWLANRTRLPKPTVKRCLRLGRAKRVLGRDPALHELVRTPAQRRADALLEMALRSATAPADGRRPEPCFTVLVGEANLDRLCELANGTVVPPGSLIPWLDKAWMERIVFGSPSRVIDVGVRTRLFTGGLRRAIQVRDRECFEELCDEPGDRCQVDHIHEFGKGGHTTQDNGRLACGFHNRQRNNPAHGP